MFNDFLISIAIAPLLVGVAAARVRDGRQSRSVLSVSWLAYAILWFGVLYYLRHRWA